MRALWALWATTALLVCATLVPVDAVYEVGRWRVGKNCGVKDDVSHPNMKRVAVEFLNKAFQDSPRPVVVASVQRPAEGKGASHVFDINVVEVDRGGFVAQVHRIDNSDSSVDVGWCYSNLDITWMAYSPTD